MFVWIVDMKPMRGVLMRKLNRRAIVKKLDKACALHVKERDDWECRWCHKEVSGHDAQWAHIIPRSDGYRLRWEPRNAVCLCYRCHSSFFHEQGLGRVWFDVEYPEEIEWLLEQKALGTKKFTTSDLQELFEWFKENTDGL